MKKAFALILALVMIIGLAACGGNGGGNGGGKEEEPAENLGALCAVQFDPPAEYATVERFTDQTADGTVKELNMTFTLADETKICYAWAAGMDLESQIGEREVESEEINGHKVYFVDSSNQFHALLQHGADVYGVQYVLPENAEGVDGKANLKEIVTALRFTEEAADVKAADIDLYDVTYTVDETLKLAGYGITVLKNTAGEITKKSVVWKYGEDLSDPDFRILVRVFRGQTLESVLNEGKEYEEKAVGDLTYTVLKVDEGETPYEYYIQHGDDVYEVRNNGKDSGWFSSRPEESVQAFDAFIATVNFK